GEHPRVDLLDDRQEQVVLGREVIDDHADAGAGVARDLAQRRPLDPVGQEPAARRLDDARLDVAARARHQISFFRKRSDDSATSTARITAIQRNSTRTSTKPLAFSTTPRTMRRKWVRGSACASARAGSGMASNGNMKPLSRMFGSKKKNDI